MAEKYGVAGNRPEARQKVCKICKKRIGRAYFVFLGERYFHAECFFTSDDYGASERQVRLLSAAYDAVQIFSPIWEGRMKALSGGVQ
jgi:hypothetical protein